MREILFRGKTDKGEWVYGDLLHPDLYGNCYAIEDFTKEKNNCFDVIPETIGQFTGLTANGTKIFEGDIVSAQYGDLKKIGCIFYYGRGAKFGIKEKNYSNFSLLHDIKIQEWNIMVIGNIHDNPELLGGEQ